MRITTNIDLHFSEDDAGSTGKGWYFQEYGRTDLKSCPVSQSFENQADAIKAFKADGITWN